MAFDALLFDLDGTVWDSFPWYADLLSTTGRVDTPTALHKLRTGIPVVVIAREVGITNRRFAALARDAAPKLVLFGDVLSTFRQLADQGVKLGVVTSLPGWLAEPILVARGLRAGLDALVHAGSCRQRKPRPEPLLLALHQLGTTATARCAYVGDLASDAQAANAAGIAFMWAAYGYGPAEPPGPCRVLSSFGELARS